MPPLPEDRPNVPIPRDPGDYDTRDGLTPFPGPLPPSAPEGTDEAVPLSLAHPLQPLPPELEAAPPAPPPGVSPLLQPLSLIALTLVACTLAALCLIPRSRAWMGRLWHTAPAEDIPPTLRTYYDRAVEGDASAMRMLGTMYYNGLNVPRNKAEGIRWYRKAAAAGSVAARKDLEQLGLAP